MSIHKTCDYCRETSLIPYSSTYKLINRYITNYKEGKYKEFQIEYLKMLIKMCPYVESYILFNEPDIYKVLGPLYFSNVLMEVSFFLRRGYLHDRKDTMDSTMIRCDYCNKKACNFHISLGGFSFGHCEISGCSRRFSICGWCQEKTEIKFKNRCVYCYRLFLGENKKMDKIDGMSIYNTNKETIDTIMPSDLSIL